MPVITYCYECKPPREGAAEAADQMARAHRYRNALAACERDRRAANEAVLREHSPELVVADTEVAVAIANVETVVRDAKRANAGAQRRVSANDDDVRQALRDARARLKESRTHQKELRRAAYADGSLAAALKTIDDAARTEARRLREDSQLYWGSYQHVEEALAEAHKGGPPSFRRWDGRGVTCVHLQGDPCPVADVLAGTRNDVRLIVDPARPTRATLSLCVPVTGQERRKGQPWTLTWAVCEVHYHRPLPLSGSVKWVRLVRRRSGTAFRYEAQFVVAVPDAEDAAPTPAGSVGIDLGWRLMADGSLRVAYWCGSDDQEGELRLPTELVSRDAVPDRLHSVRDRLFDGARAGLAAWTAGAEMPVWIGERIARLMEDVAEGARHSSRELAAWEALRTAWPTAAPAVPDWFRERLAGMLANPPPLDRAREPAPLLTWKSPARLAAVVLEWRGRRFAGDEAIHEVLECWRRQDKHLCDWEAFGRLSVQRARADLYRKFAAKMRREYAVAFLENVNWREIGERPDVDETSEYGISAYRRLAAVGTLAKFIGEKQSATKVAPEESTTRCHRCRNLCEWDQARQLRHVCEHCGCEWDQDQNAAKNLLARGLAAEGKSGAARETEDDGGNEAATAPVRRSRRNRRTPRQPLAEGGVA